MSSKPTEEEGSSSPSSFVCFLSSSFPHVEIKLPPLLHRFRFLLFVLLCYLLWLRLLFFSFPAQSEPPPSAAGYRGPQPSRPPDACDPDIAPFYIHQIHPRFNAALVQSCLSRLACCDVCSYVGHHGLGRPLLRLPGAADSHLEGTSWYATHPSAAEMLFHARADRHPCRTMDPEEAVLFYVPFYAGLHVSACFGQANHTLRDALAIDLASQLSSLPFFGRHSGRDHFLAIGRPSWDFMRSPSRRDSGANRLLLLPEIANMMTLTVERHPLAGPNLVGIPYPSYFHPRTAAEVLDWQAELRLFGRTHLFAFVGGAMSDSETSALRTAILNQCRKSAQCMPVQCRPDSQSHDCHDPDRVLDVMRRADFCLQPPGESFTRRSTFDSLLAGCIPVFFSEHSASTQYEWYLPGRPEAWSVLLKPDRWERIEEALSRISRAEVERMREQVIELIPRVSYAHPDSARSELGFRDAVDVALVELTKRVRSTPPLAQNSAL